MKIYINNKEIETLPGETLIEVARREGFSIPSLCYAKDAKHKSSCMVCAVRNSATGQIIPSCTTLPTEGMQIDSESAEVKQTRTLSLELLLSDHRADCLAPCQNACPGNMDVARMNRLYDQGRRDEALALLRDTLVIPATLCYICPAPCEKICRKGDVNTFVPIREMKKELVAETVLNSIRPATEKNGKRIAVKGSNPAALATAYDLLKRGYQVVIFEPSDTLLAPYIPAGLVPPETLALETDVLRRMGAEIRLSAEAPAPGADGFDGVIDTSQIKVRQPARLTLEGHRLAEELNASLFPSVATNGNEPASKEFNSTFPRFNEAEKRALNKPTPAPSNVSGCLYCDCNAKTNCRLRAFATAYGVKNSRYAKVNDSEALHRQSVGNGIWFEPAKCIKCGLCVYNSRNGFTFKHRGFVMQVVLPEENAVNVEVELAEICPTGALYAQNNDR